MNECALRRFVLWVVVVVTLFSAGMHLWGVRHELPFVIKSDETVFVDAALGMIAEGTLNPRWFGNPGSTMIYPLAAIYHGWDVVMNGARLFHADPKILERYRSNPATFHLLGRCLSVAYGVMAIPFVYLLGRRAFGQRVGIAGAWLFAGYALAVSHAQEIRTDSAGAFFGVLSLWLCLRICDEPTLLNQAFAGAAIGLGIASRYFMIMLVPVLLAIDGYVVWKQGSGGDRVKLRLGIVIGLLAIACAFAVSTPFMFIDYHTAVRDIRLEARTTHEGADGLSPLGNARWYLSKAIPQAMSIPQAILGTAGLILVFWRRRFEQSVLGGFVVIFTIGICSSALHWARWFIPILPVLALFAADAMDRIVNWLAQALRASLPWHAALFAGGVILASTSAVRDLALQDVQQSRPSTRLVARQWMVENLPVGAKIAEEWYTAPLDGTEFAITEQFALATDCDLDDYKRAGYRYLVVSSAVYNRFLAEPARYGREVAFYKTLFSSAILLHMFEPMLHVDHRHEVYSWSDAREPAVLMRGGPTISIYELLPLGEKR
jgi:hypothetical protein